jgi:hypothetical protein
MLHAKRTLDGGIAGTVARPAGDLGVMDNLSIAMCTTINDFCGLEGALQTLSGGHTLRNTFPFPVYGGERQGDEKPMLPLMFLSVLMAAKDGPLADVASGVNLKAANGTEIGLSYLIKNLPDGSVTEKMETLVRNTQDYEKTMTERFVISLLQTFEELRVRTGLSICGQQMLETTRGLCRKTDVPTPSNMGVDVGYLMAQMDAEHNLEMIKLAGKVEENRTRLVGEKTKAIRSAIATISQYMELEKANEREATSIAKQMLEKTTEHQAKKAKLMTYSTMGSHSLSLDLWLKARQVKPITIAVLDSLGKRTGKTEVAHGCLLSGIKIVDTMEKNTLVIVNPNGNENDKRVCLYTYLVQSMLMRGLYGFNLYGEPTPNGDLNNYAGLTGRNGFIVYRACENGVREELVASNKDVTRILNHSTVAPWWQLIQWFNVYEPLVNKDRVASAENVSKVLEILKDHINDANHAKILSAHEGLMATLKGNNLTIPQDFAKNFMSTLSKKACGQDHYVHKTDPFSCYMNALYALADAVRDVFIDERFKMKNPEDVNF